MKALVRTLDSRIQLQNILEPQIQHDDEVKIQIVYSTLCRDDMWDDPNNTFHREGIIGHEATGIICDTGHEASMHGFKKGDRVAISPFEACGICKNCIEQKPHYCSSARLSTGLIAEYVIKKHTQLIKISEDISFPQASLIEPVGDILEALEKLNIKFSNRILLIGAGFTGLTFLKLLRLRGVKNITVIEPLAERRDIALTYGADYVLKPFDENLSINLLKATNFECFDYIIDTSAHLETINSTLPSLIRGGSILLFAYNNPQAKLILPYFNMYMTNVNLIWSCMCSHQNMIAAIDIIKRLELQKLITAQYPLQNGVYAFNRYLTTKEIKIGIQMISLI